MDLSKIVLSVFNVFLHDILSFMFDIQSRLTTSYSTPGLLLQTCAVLPVLFLIHDVWYIFIHKLFHLYNKVVKDVHQRCLDKRRNTSYWEMFSFHPIEFLILIDLPLLLFPLLFKIQSILYYEWLLLTFIQLYFVSNSGDKGALFYKFWYRHRKNRKNIDITEHLLDRDISLSYVTLPFHLSKKDAVKIVSKFIKQYPKHGKFVINYHITEDGCENDVESYIRKAIYSDMDHDKQPWRLHLIHYEKQTHIVFKCDNLYHYDGRKSLILSLIDFYRQNTIVFNIPNVKVNHYEDGDKILQTHIKDINIKEILTCNGINIEHRSTGIREWMHDRFSGKMGITVDGNGDIKEERLDNLYLTAICENDLFSYGLITKEEIDVSKIHQNNFTPDKF